MFIYECNFLKCMKRKVIQLGGSTLVVSLPSKWVKDIGLQPGTEVSVEEVSGKLMIGGDSTTPVRETTINITKDSETSIRVLITNAYRAGYDRITVTFKNQKQFDIMKSIVKTRLVGFEIVVHEKNSCAIENITEPTADQFEKVLRKEFFAIDELITELLAKRTSSIEDIEECIHRYDNFCKRIIAKEHFGSPKSELLWNFLSLLVHGQRELYHLKPTPADVPILNGLREIIGLLQKGYFDKDSASTEIIHEKYHQLLELINERNPNRTYLYASLRMFYLASSPLAGLLT